MEFTFKLYITDDFGKPEVRTYSTIAEDIDSAYEKVISQFYAEKNDGEHLYKIWRYEII